MRQASLRAGRQIPETRSVFPYAAFLLHASIDHGCADAEADKAPEPDALHGRLERDVEAGIDYAGRGVGGDEQKQSAPFGLTPATRENDRVQQRAKPGSQEDAP